MMKTLLEWSIGRREPSSTGSAAGVDKQSTYRLFPKCKSLNPRLADKCYSCRTELELATKLAVDAKLGVVPIERYLTPEEAAERDAAEAARRAAERAAHPPP